MRRLVLDLADERPVFALPAAVVAAVRRALPDGWELAVVDAPARGTGDGGAVASPEALEAVEGAEVYMGYGVPPALLRAGQALRWVHTGTAGVGASLTPELGARDLLFTNSAGIHGPPVAETVLAFILHFARGLDHALDAQRRGEWGRAVFDGAEAPVRELGESVVGVVGLGGIGRAVARRARSLGCAVVATRRRDHPVGAVEGLEGVELLGGDDALDRLLGAAHYVVLTLPETAATRGLIGAGALERMRRDAVLINVSRGGLVDEEALVTALVAGRIRGTALDVFSTEPLPAGHPLWSAPSALLTPHTSAYSRRFWDREGALIVENLGRYLAGEPLLNVVDREAGY